MNELSEQSTHAARVEVIDTLLPLIRSLDYRLNYYRDCLARNARGELQEMDWNEYLHHCFDPLNYGMDKVCGWKNDRAQNNGGRTGNE